MHFSEILGQEHIKSHLQQSIKNARIPHAQMFVGKAGSGVLPMALAYARFLLSPNGVEKTEAGQASSKKGFYHPDLHFAYPVAINHKVKTHPVSKDFIEEWNDFILNKPYGDLYDWYQSIGIEGKQGQLGVDEAKDVVSALSLKAYEGGYKIMIIWGADKMNIACANKLLKIIEEPPDKTVFILITENEDSLISTIKSRCQVLHFPLLSETVIADGLMRLEALNEAQAKTLAHQADGSFSKALHLLHRDSTDEQFEIWFLTWVRAAFKAKTNKSEINKLLDWSLEQSKTGRETQKLFLNYCMQVFRQALLKNYKADALIYFTPFDSNFKLENFAPFVHGNNILDIYEAIQDAIYHIERNGNAKIIFTDLSIKLTRFLHKKTASVSK